MKRQDWLLTFIGFPPGSPQPVDRMQIMKGLFLMRMAMEEARQLKKLGQFYRFQPYMYGPCCFKIYDDLDLLSSEGLLQTDRQAGNPWIMYYLTEAGKEKVLQLVEKIPEHLIKKLEAVKKQITNQSIWDTLRVIYKKYPQYATNSVLTRLK